VFIPPFNNFSYKNRFIFFLISSFIAYIYWIFLSGRFIISTKKNVIGIALRSTNPKTQTIIDNALLRIKDRLRSLRLLDKFKIIEIGTDIFSTFEEAEKYILEKRRMHLIIHGTVYGGNYESNYRYDLKNSFFTYSAPFRKDSPYFKAIQNDINLILSNRDWNIEESNTIIDIEKVSDNLVEILLAIVAIVLCGTYKNLSVSISLLETLLPILESKVKPEDRKVEISKEKSTVKMPLDLLRSGRLRVILNDCYVAISRIFIEEKKYREAINTLEKAIRTGADKYNCYAGLALALYYESGIEKAKEYTIKMNNEKKDTILYFLNMAFFSIKNRSYDEAIKYYDSIRKRKNEVIKTTLIEEVIQFLKNRHKEEPSEIAYLYGIGVLTYNFISQDEGRSFLTDFLNKAEQTKNYDPIINITKIILKNK
tara:strand:+ start:1019 stop:2293 length:1275 start_codon:yes stop_codon:yes gene_type:complete